MKVKSGQSLRTGAVLCKGVHLYAERCRSVAWLIPGHRHKYRVCSEIQVHTAASATDCAGRLSDAHPEPMVITEMRLKLKDTVGDLTLIVNLQKAIQQACFTSGFSQSLPNWSQLRPEA